MSRIMADSTTFADIPTNIDVVAVYINGSYGVVSQATLEERYPNNRYGHVFIDVNGSRPDADVRDWETGDKSGSLEQWVIDHNVSSGRKDAVIYCNRSTIPEVRLKTGSQILNQDYFLWISTLDGTRYTGLGVIACQDKSPTQTFDHYDESIIYDDRFWQPKDSKAVAKPDCRQFQTAIRVSADGLWGSDTDRHANAIIAATVKSFPFGVIAVQSIVHTVQDGIWGNKSAAMLAETITSMQNALNEMGFSTKGVDGIWGPNTGVAYMQARTACHI